MFEYIDYKTLVARMIFKEVTCTPASAEDVSSILVRAENVFFLP